MIVAERSTNPPESHACTAADGASEITAAPRKHELAGDSVAAQISHAEMPPLIITVAPLGAELPKDTPHLPYKLEDFANTAVACAELGATIVHIHCRTEAGKNTHTVKRFRKISAAIRAKCRAAKREVILQYSTGGSVSMTQRQRGRPLKLNPQMATLSCGSMNFGRDVFLNPWPMIVHFADEMGVRNIVPEFEIYDLGHIATLKQLIRKGKAGAIHRDGRLVRPLHVDFVLGVPGGAPGTEENLKYMLSQLPENCTWGVAGIGKSELPMAKLAIDMGGHVRVGLEDNTRLEDGTPARNEQLVERVAAYARERGRRIASAAEAREILGIPHNDATRYREAKRKQNPLKVAVLRWFASRNSLAPPGLAA